MIIFYSPASGRGLRTRIRHYIDSVNGRKNQVTASTLRRHSNKL